jgi:hypothetical protein
MANTIRDDHVHVDYYYYYYYYYNRVLPTQMPSGSIDLNTKRVDNSDVGVPAGVMGSKDKGNPRY